MTDIDRRRGFTAVAIFIVSALTACGNAPPAINLVPGGAEVHVVSARGELAAGCVEIGRTSVGDGEIGKKNGYIGTDERALLRLRNKVVEMGGDSLVLLDKSDPKNDGLGIPLDTLPLDCEGDCGRVAWMTGIVFKCGSTHSNR